jgi:hypothetical protein
MSDGPHKSLPMRTNWRKLAERAANHNFQSDEIAEAIPAALTGDWEDEGCDELVRQLRVVLNDDRQGTLFDQPVEEKLEALNKISGSGFPLRRLVLECVTQEVESGVLDSNAVSNGVERALGERLARGTLQVEEHYRRSTDEGADRVRHSIQNAALQTSLSEITNRLLKTGDKSGNPPSSKKDGLDDGVPL